MIGEQPTGLVAGVHFIATASEGLRVLVNGKPAILAVIYDGEVVAEGAIVCQEASSVAVNNYRNFLMGQGHLTVQSKPLDEDPAGAQEPMGEERRTG